MFNKLGIRFKHGKQVYKVNALINDYNFLYTLKEQITPCNVIIGEAWFHTNNFCQMIYEYFKNKKYKHFITHANKYKKRYKQNNDLFIHLRLGDVSDYNDNKDMYNRICNKINNITYDKIRKGKFECSSLLFKFLSSYKKINFITNNDTNQNSKKG